MTRNTSSSYAIGAAVIAAVLITVFQVWLIVIVSNPQSGQPPPPVVIPWTVWGLTPLGFAAMFASVRPSSTGAWLAAATYFGLNLTAVLVLAPRLVGVLGRLNS
jgi:hypothetical protein